MKEGQLKSSNRSGCLMYLALIYAFPMLAALAVLPLGVVYLCFRAGEIGNGLFVLAVEAGAVYLFIKYKRKGKKEEAPKNPNTAVLRTEAGGVQLGNPFRGVFVLGAAGSGKSESIAVPLLSEFVRMGFAGVVYDFKFPTLAKDVQSFVNAKGSVLRHFYLDFNNPAASYRVNPLNPRYLPNTSYAREYAQAIISNLMKESIKKPDFWTRSATDLLTACIWYLKEERPDICDLPHVLAMITSNDTALLKTLQKNVQTAQMTVSIYNAMERGADSQVSGVIGTLQGAIAQINTPELMFLFSGDDALKPARVLSGGEKTRLALATLVTSRANVLLLDEPTNNLDPASREEILKAIAKYEGAIVLVTHDEGAVQALNPERVLLMPDGDEDLWNDSYLELVAEE